MASISPWIAVLIEKDIDEVLTWQESLNNNIKVEEDRFSNDGSNFRSVVSQNEPGKSEVQLIEVLSDADPTSGVQAVISDGDTTLKARLAPSVVEILEYEIEEKLGRSTGHVFRLLRFTIVMTGIGPADEWIQLNVEKIDYLYTKRRRMGEPSPIEQNSNIRGKITDSVTPLLCYTAEVEGEDAEGEAADGEEAQGGNADGEVEDFQSQPLQRDDSSVAVARSPPPMIANDRPAQSGLSESPASVRKRPLHTLANDGFELRKGVNLQGPVKANQTNGNTLLRLLNNEQNQPEVIAETPARPLNHARDVRGKGLFSGVGTVESEPARRSPKRKDVDVDVAIGPSRPQAPRSSPPLPEAPQDDRPRSESPQPVPPRPSIPRLSPQRFTHPRVSTGAAEPAGSKLPTQHNSTRSTQVRARIPFGRRKIPADQQALLDNKDSWLPSLPGCRFPTPNVPIELLKKWNAAPSPSQKSTAASSRDNVSPIHNGCSTRVSQRGIASPQQDKSSSGSHSTDESDGMVSEAEWPLTQSPCRPQAQPQARPELPPDSSIGEVVRGTPDDLVVSPPRALEAQSSTQRTNGQQQGIRRHPLPNRPSVTMSKPSQRMLNSQQSQQMTASPTAHARTEQSPRGPQARHNGQRATLNGAPSPSTPTGSRSKAPRVNKRHSNNSAESSRSTPKGRYDSYRPAPQVDQAPGSSQSTARPPAENIRKARREWREERLKAEQLKARNEMMREFVLSFINIRPGGAFAPNHATNGPTRYRPVDVLSWNT